MTDVGLFDSVKAALGIRAESDATKRADPEDLFGMSTAYVTMEAELGFVTTGEAALCFSEVDSTDFGEAIREVEDILEAGEEETGTTFDRRVDTAGYSWVVLRDDDTEDLLTSIHFAADTLVDKGYGSRLLAALFPFEPDRTGGSFDADYAYWVYSFRRGAYYPFAPVGTSEQDDRLLLKLEAVLDGELDLEPDKEYWYPLWPERPGRHPWG